MIIPIFKPGLINYTDHGLDKPVKITENFLKNIAATTSNVKLTDEHKKEVIGQIENFTYQNGSLQIPKPEDIDIVDKGISPVFELNLVSYDDHYLAVDGILKEAGLTSTPRNHILYNSILNPEEDERMGDLNETLKKALGREQEQQETIGQLKAQLQSASNSIKEKQGLEKKLQDAEKAATDSQETIDELKKKADKFDELEKEKKEGIIKELVGEDEKLGKELEDLPYEKLKFLKESKIINQDPKGVGSKGAPGLNDDGTKKKKDDEESYEDWRKKQNTW
jgi:hypothetical protein